MAQVPSQLTVLQQDSVPVLAGPLDYGFLQGTVRQGNTRSPGLLRPSDDQELARSQGSSLAHPRRGSYDLPRAIGFGPPAISAVVPPVVAAAMVAHKLAYMGGIGGQQKDERHLRINLAQVEQDSQAVYTSEKVESPSESESASDSPCHRVRQ